MNLRLRDFCDALAVAGFNAQDREMYEITIKGLKTASEYDQAVELQKIYWGDCAETLVPTHMLQSLCDHGGHVLGARHQGRLVGFVMGFIGTDIDWEDADARPARENLLIMSKRMVVLPQYRGQNIGFRLKMAQREVALKQGIRRVTWTFDPLLSTNAHLNIRKLGGVIRRYKVNYFGLTQQKSLRADRLTVEWRVTGHRVKERARGGPGKLTLQQYLDRNALMVNPADVSGQWILPAAVTHAPDSAFALVEIPSDIRELEARQPKLAETWRDHIRVVFPQVLDAGYAVRDFVRDDFEGRNRSFYVLSHHLDDGD